MEWYKEFIGETLTNDFYYNNIVIKKGTKIKNIEKTNYGFDITFDVNQNDVKLYDLILMIDDLAQITM